jgi:hypothetical protein
LDAHPIDLCGCDLFGEGEPPRVGIISRDRLRECFDLVAQGRWSEDTRSQAMP